MEISILLTILLIIISLGGAFLQEGKICLVNEEQINDLVTIKYDSVTIKYDSATIKYDLRNSLFHWAVKLVLRGLYLLNTVALAVAQKVTQSTSIQLQNHKFEG